MIPGLNSLTGALSSFCVCQPSLSGCITKTCNMPSPINALISDSLRPAAFRRETQHDNLRHLQRPLSLNHTNVAALAADRRSDSELKITAAAKEISMAAGALSYLDWTLHFTFEGQKERDTIDCVFCGQVSTLVDVTRHTANSS